jgi:hypothetical protein
MSLPTPVHGLVTLVPSSNGIGYSYCVQTKRGPIQFAYAFVRIGADWWKNLALALDLDVTALIKAADRIDRKNGGAVARRRAMLGTVGKRVRDVSLDWGAVL